jgi:hypothetical protein
MTVRAALLGLLALWPASGGAATLKVGPQEAFKLPSEAARAAKDGDTVEIAAGEYFDCAVWPQNGITIAGPETGEAVLTDRTCRGKAIFVIGGRDVTVRRLTFTRARVIDGNGAGIRAEGHGLTVAHSRFVNNQSGILAAPQPGAEIVVLDSVFERNGTLPENGRCVPTLDLLRVGTLRIERSAFLAPRGCDGVRAVADRVAISDSRFEDGAAGAGQAMVFVHGATLSVRGSVFAKGPRAQPPDVAIVLRDLEGAGGGVELGSSRLVNESGRPMALLRNLSPGAVVLSGNSVGRGDSELEGGLWAARARAAARAVIDGARAAAGAAKRAVGGLLPF